MFRSPVPMVSMMSSKVMRPATAVFPPKNLFGTVTNADVVAALKAQHGHELDRRTVEIAEAIRTVGPHEATVRLEAQVQATLKLDVVAIEA